MSSTFDALVSQYLREEQTLPRVTTEPSTQITDFDPYALAVALRSGTGTGIDNQTFQDFRTLSQNDLIQKYGSDAYSQVTNALAGAETRYERDRTYHRSEGDSIRDVTLATGQGLLGGLGGLGALGLGLINDDAGVWAAEKLQDMNNWVSDNQSDAMNARRRAGEAASNLTSTDNEVSYQNERAELGDTVASLRRIGRNIVDEGAIAATDPLTLTDGVAQGAGSLLGGGLISGGLKAIGKGVVSRIGAGRAAAVAVQSPRGFDAAVTVGRTLDRARMPLAIGGLEGGGAYTATANEIMAMSSDELRASSPEYMDLLLTGMSEHDARVTIANRAGQTAAAIQAPIGVATGALVSKFEGAPLRVGSLREGAGNVVRETVEEGLQSGSGALAQNIAMRRADEDYDLSANIGEDIARGAIYGAGTAGVFQAPGMTVRSAVEGTSFGVRQIVRGGQWTINQVLARGDRVIEGLNAKQAAEMDAAMAVAATNVDVSQDQVIAAVNELDLPEETKNEAFDYLDKVFNAARIDPEEAQFNLPVVNSLIEGSNDRFEALRRVTQFVADTKNDTRDRLAGAFYILDQFKANEALINQDLPEALAQLPADHEARKELEAFEKVITSVGQHPEVMKAIKFVRELPVSVEASEVSEEKLDTPEGKRAVVNAIGIAEHNPAKMNPKLAEEILSHAYVGRIQLTPAQVAALESSMTTVIENEKAKEKQRRLLLNTNIDIVSREIVSDRRAEDKNLSAVEHTMGVVQAYRSGNMALAQAKLEEFVKFAQSMQNKTAAYNAAIEEDRLGETKLTPFQSLDPATGEFFNSKGVWLDPNHYGSIRLAQQVGLDAAVVGTMANTLVRTMSDLGVKPVALVTLNEALDAPAGDVKKAFRQKRATTSDQRAEARAKELEATKKQDEPTPQKEVEPEVDATPVEDQADANAERSLEPVRDPAVAETKEEETKTEEAPKVEAQTIEPQVEETPEAPVVEEPEQGELFPDLLSPAGDRSKNRFLMAFKRPAKTISRLLGSGSPLAQLKTNLKSAAALQEAMGDTPLKSKFEAPLAKAYDQYLSLVPTLAKAMSERMAAFLSDEARKNDPHGRSVLDFLKGGLLEGDYGNTVERWNRGKSANILNEDGTYNQELLEGAILAGLQWYLTGNGSGRVLNDEDVGQILQKDPSLVTPNELAFFQNGVSLGDAKRALGQKILSYWGLTSDNDVALAYTNGIPEAVGAEVLAVMLEQGLLVEETLEIVGTDEYKSPKKLNFVKPESLQTVLETVETFNTAIDKAVLVEPVEEVFIGEAPKQVAEFQMRNRLVRNSAQQKEAIRNEQNTPHFWNRTFVDFLSSMGLEGALELFGAGDLESQALNDTHRKSLAGQNITIASAYEAMMKMVGQTMDRAAVDGVEFTEVPVHFLYNVSKVGRLHMQGRHNPQSNKLSREMVMPTFSTSDLTQKANLDRFLLAVGQAWGLKVHKQKRAETVKQVRALVRKPEVEAALKLGRDWLEGGFDISSEEIAVLKKAGIPSTPASINALMEYARYQSSNTEARKAFRTPLYVEADGVTDGPINALLHMATGLFSADWIENMGKGGLFLNARGQTMNDNPDKVDLYASVKNHLSTAMGARRTLFGSTAETHEHMEALLRVMNQLLPDQVSVNSDGQLVLDRGLVKNPLTVTIYGSGQAGIAQKVMGALTDAFYEKMSKLAKAVHENPKVNPALVLFGDMAQSEAQATEMYARFNRDLDALTKIVAIVDRDGQPSLVDNSKDTTPKDQTPEGYAFTPNQLKNLSENILTMFVNPLQSAITETMGDVDKATVALRKATQSQSIFLKYAFMREIDRLKEKKKATEADYRNGDFLTQNELNAIYDRLKHLSPFIEAQDMPLWVGGSERSELAATEWAATLDDKLRSNISIYGPTNAGVAGIPTTIIGLGDGRMMQNIATMEGRPDRTIKIFDGMHMPLDLIESASRKVNEAVHMGWMTNPLADVEKSFSAFLRDVNTETVTDEQLYELAQALFSKRQMAALFNDSKKPYAKSRKAILDELYSVGEQLKTYSEEAEARHRVLAKLEMTVDHMASGEAPFVSQGLSLNGMDTNEMVEIMNAMFKEELESIRSADASSENVAEDLKALGAKDEASGVRVMRTEEIMSAVAGMNIPADQKAFLKPVLKALEDKGYTVVLGSPKQTSAYAQARQLRQMSASQSVEQSIQGYTVMGDRMIYLHNTSSETLLHELIHAATLEKVAAVYESAEGVSKEETEAVQRLEGLMNEWLQTEDNLVELNADIRLAFERAKAAVLERLNATTGLPTINKAAALNEFMAWNLSNQDLVRTAQRTKVQNPLLRVVGEALKALKELIFGKARAPRVSDDLYSNIRFNTAVLLQNTNSVQQNLADVVAFQSYGFGMSDRLTALRQQYANLIGSVLESAPTDIDKAVRQTDLKLVSAKATKISDVFNAHGFPMTMQERSTFRWIVAALMTDVVLNPNSITALQGLYEHVTKNLSVESFMRDPDGNDQADRYQAQEKFNSIMGVNATEYDSGGKSSLLPAFVALASTNEAFREVLSKMPMPKAELEKWNTLDNVLTNTGRLAMERLGDMMSGTKRNAPNIKEAIDALTVNAANVVEDEKNFIVQFGQKSADVINTANQWFVDHIQDLSSKAIRKTREIETNSNSKVVKTAAGVGQVMAAIVNKEESSNVAMGVMQHLNEMRLWRPVHELFNEIIGRTPQNGTILDMVKGVKSVVQQTRQQFREELPEILAEKFSRELSDAEWSAMHKSLAKTDLAALRSVYSMSEIIRMLHDDTFRDAEISRLEGRIQSNASRRWPMLQKKSQELADFMTTGKVSGNLLRNADAVAHLFGELGALPAGTSPDAQLVTDLDHLISLYALKAVPSDLVAELAQSEQDGMDFLMSYLVGQRKDEQAKTTTSRARINHYKGFIPTENQQGVALIVADDTEFGRLSLQGFTRVASYTGSAAERGARARSYFFSPVSGRSFFKQGIMQNVRATASGVDPVTGFSYGHINTAGRISDKREVAMITRLRSANEKATEPLMPVYDSTGEVVAYERSIDPMQEVRLNQNTHLGEMIGAWRGRQVEEAMASHFNDLLIERLYDMWKDEQAQGRENEYVDLFAKNNDPVLQDAVSLFTPETLNKIHQKFGGSTFMVRKDLVNDVAGYRDPSVGDLWTGNTRIDENTRTQIQRAVIGVFGPTAYRHLVGAEKFYENVISAARVMIVVKSVIVPMSNLLSNIYQLSARGVPVINTLRQLPAKTAEVDTYVKHRLRQIQLEAELRAVDNDLVKERKLTTELQSIKDANQRMSIWPLIQAGEFASISEGGITREELALTEGRLTDYIESLVDKLPSQVKTAGRYAIIAKDTALFRGLARTIEYGDFLAKAVLYDDLTKRQKMSHEDALVEISEEFVNYDRLPGRVRGKLESMGLLWFWNFKIRSAKVAVSMVRNNPLQTLLTTLAPAPSLFGSVGLPTSDNIFSVLADGRIDNSMGLGQGLRAPHLIPWVQLAN